MRFEQFAREDPGLGHTNIRQEIDVNSTAVCILPALMLAAPIREREAAVVNINSDLALAAKTASASCCASHPVLHGAS